MKNKRTKAEIAFRERKWDLKRAARIGRENHRFLWRIFGKPMSRRISRRKNQELAQAFNRFSTHPRIN